MDVGNKTLSQLSDEAKEKRYVSLETGAKISGYTKEYLERLCRMNKLEYRLWNHGEFVVELASLLAETHAILLSYEDINFVEKSLLAPQETRVGSITPVASTENERSTKETAATEAGRILSEKVAEGITQDVPSFRGAEHLTSIDGTASPFSFVGHAVVSNSALRNEKLTEKSHPVPPTNPEVKKDKPIEVTPVSSSAPDQDASPSPHILTHVPIIGTPLPVTESADLSSTVIPVHAPLPKAQLGNGGVVRLSPVAPEAPSVHSVTHLSVKRDEEPARSKEEKEQEWDAMLLGDHTGIRTPVLSTQPTMSPPVAPSLSGSPYHPVQTAVDASVHHEDLPLFPAVGANTIASVVPATSRPQGAPVRPGIPDLGENKRTIVFTPEEANSTAMSSYREAPSTTVIPGNSLISVPHAPVRETATVAVPTIKTPASVTSNKVAVPAMRVMQHDVAKVEAQFPTVAAPHQLIIREEHPLTKSLGFNFVFALFLSGVGLLAVGGSMGKMPFISNSVSYIASVGAALSSDATSNEQPAVEKTAIEQNSVLPFSDEIYVATGTSNSIIVQPVFRDSAGSAHEYKIPEADK